MNQFTNWRHRATMQSMSKKCILTGRICTLLQFLAFLLLLFVMMFNELKKPSDDTILEFPSNLAKNLENIYFIETSNATTLPSRAQCSIESAATNNPKSMVNVLLTSGIMENKILDRLTSFKNVVFQKINPDKFLEGNVSHFTVNKLLNIKKQKFNIMIELK